MDARPCHLIVAFLTAAGLAACDQDSGGLDAASEPDTSPDPLEVEEVAPEPADPPADPAIETTADPSLDMAPDPTVDPHSDPDTDGANPGCVVRDTPGCGGCACESCVCEIEPHCCTNFWDEACVWDCEFICGADC